MADATLAEALSLRGEPLLQAAERPFAIGYVAELEEATRAESSAIKAGLALGRQRQDFGTLPSFTRRWAGEPELDAIRVHALYRNALDQAAARTSAAKHLRGQVELPTLNIVFVTAYYVYHGRH